MGHMLVRRAVKIFWAIVVVEQLIPPTESDPCAEIKQCFRSKKGRRVLRVYMTVHLIIRWLFRDCKTGGVVDIHKG